MLQSLCDTKKTTVWRCNVAADFDHLSQLYKWGDVVKGISADDIEDSVCFMREITEAFAYEGIVLRLKNAYVITIAEVETIEGVTLNSHSELVGRLGVMNAINRHDKIPNWVGPAILLFMEAIDDVQACVDV